MSDFVTKPDTGSLFATKSKKTQASPDYFGDIHVNLKDLTGFVNGDGFTTIKISGWKKTSKMGSTYLSLAVSRYVPEDQQQQPQRRAAPVDDSDIPF